MKARTTTRHEQFALPFLDTTSLEGGLGLYGEFSRRSSLYSKSFYPFISRRWNEALGAANAGLAIDPNDAALYSIRSAAETSLGQYEQAKSDALQGIGLSPRDPFVGAWHLGLGDAELGLGHFDSAIESDHKSIDLGFRAFQPYVDLAAVYALEGKTEEARTALAEARRLNPKLTVKWLQSIAPDLPPLFEGVRKAGCRKNERDPEIAAIRGSSRFAVRPVL